MLLTQDNIFNYLLEKELVQREIVVDGDMMAVAMPTRNNLYKILSSKGNNLFVKQTATFGHVETGILKREAGAYQFISKNDGYKTLSESLPEFINYDSTRHVLVVRYFTNTISTHDYCIKQKTFPVALAREQADILYSFHFPVDKDADTSAFPKSLPWILQINDHGAYDLFPNNKVNGQLINMIQKHTDLRAQLLSLRKDWNAVSLIHGDVKWMNFIVKQNDTPKQYLVDWELADIGDPYWDVAGILQSYLAAWVFSFDNNTLAQTRLHDHMLAFDIEKMKPAIQGFWQQYSQRAGLSIADNKQMLTKSVKYAAARMIQTAIEGVVYNPAILPNNMRSIQIAHNILKAPEEAAKELFGINI